jgi:hypothetical protein
MKLRSTASIVGIAISGIVVGGAFSPASAAGLLLTNNTGYTGPTLDLSTYANGTLTYTLGPAPIGAITFTANNGGGITGNGAVLGQGAYSLGDNGDLDVAATYVGLDSATGYMTFTFASPVSSFGAFMNYVPASSFIAIGETNYTNPIISAYDSSNNLLDSFDLSTAAPISTPGALNQFAFRGISGTSAPIASFRLSGSYLIAASSANGFVGSTIPTSPTTVPEPFTVIGTLIGGTAAFRLKKKLKSDKI